MRWKCNQDHDTYFTIKFGKTFSSSCLKIPQFSPKKKRVSKEDTFQNGIFHDFHLKIMHGSFPLKIHVFSHTLIKILMLKHFLLSSEFSTLKSRYSEQVHDTLFVHCIEQFTISNVICLVNPQNGLGFCSLYREIHYIEVRYIKD